MVRLLEKYIMPVLLRFLCLLAKVAEFCSSPEGAQIIAMLEIGYNFARLFIPELPEIPPISSCLCVYPFLSAEYCSNKRT